MRSNGYRWKREIPLTERESIRERWTLETGDESFEFPVDVRFGKEIDMAAVKKRWPYRRQRDFVRQKMDYFEKTFEVVPVERCPVCSTGREAAEHYLTICAVDYLQCGHCTHVYAAVFPTLESVEKYYREDPVKNDYYLEPDEIELRLQEIYLPKIEWIAGVYEGIFGRRPESILDMGAGAGHFLYACKRSGLQCRGIEYSEKYGRWSREQFGIELCRDKDAVGAATFDIVTSFNVIEHVYEPKEFVEDYKRFMGGESIAVIETPKVNSLTTRLQRIFPDDLRGHLKPYEHNHLFTDASLATLLFMNGLGIRSLWYFGQDAAELLWRICYEVNAESAGVFEKLYRDVQAAVDLSRASDLMMAVAVPLE